MHQVTEKTSGAPRVHGLNDASCCTFERVLLGGHLRAPSLLVLLGIASLPQNQDIDTASTHSSEDGIAPKMDHMRACLSQVSGSSSTYRPPLLLL